MIRNLIKKVIVVKLNHEFSPFACLSSQIIFCELSVDFSKSNGYCILKFSKNVIDTDKNQTFFLTRVDGHDIFFT